MHDVSLPAADFGAKPDTCRNPPLPHTFDRFSLKHTRVRGLPFFFLARSHARHVSNHRRQHSPNLNVAQPSTFISLSHFQIQSAKFKRAT
jgi:hypothetical protein